MNKKRSVCWGGVVLLAIAIAGVVWMVRGPDAVSAVTLFPRDTHYYCGSQSPLKIRAALQAVDLPAMLQETAALTADESQIVSDWIGGLQGAHVGFRSFTLFPFVLDATVVLEGSFDRPLTDLLTTDIQRRFQGQEPYRDVAFEKMVLPLHKMVSLEIYVTEPVQNRVLIALSRRSLTESIDRMIDGGASLAGNVQFKTMCSRKEVRRADVIQYMDQSALLQMFYDWVQSVPQPQVKSLSELFWNELRLGDYGDCVTGWHWGHGVSRSVSRIEPSHPLCQQLRNEIPLQLPHVPLESSQFTFCRLVDPADAMRRFVNMTVRIAEGIAPVAGAQTVQPIHDVLGRIGFAVGGNPAELGDWFTGEIGLWQGTPNPASSSSPLCVFIGIRDPQQLREMMATLGWNVSESEDIFTLADSNAVQWSIQSNGLFIANDVDYLTASLCTQDPSLIDSPSVQEMLRTMPRAVSVVEYSSYEAGFASLRSAGIPPSVQFVLDLLKGYRKISVCWAEEGLIHTQAIQRFNPDVQSIQAILKHLFSADWSRFEANVNTEPPFEHSAQEAYEQSIDLLSAGRQSDAEKLIERAVRAYPKNERILFSQAVLERSRWGIRAAHSYFKKAKAVAPETYIAQVSKLAIELDSKTQSIVGLKKLIEFSDAHPDDIYLLWFSAIQCREQAQKDEASSKSKLKVAKLGRTQYEKLLAKFRVGPVMAHHTYANILTEYLNDHEASLKHRHKAVAAEARGWTLQGLANTLSDMKRYEESCVAWAQALRLDPDSAENWRQWGNTLYKMNDYEEALVKYEQSVAFDSSYAFTYYRMGLCNLKLKKYDLLFPLFKKSADMGEDYASFEVGNCYRYGRGCETNLVEAAVWFERAATQGVACSQRTLGRCYEKGLGVTPDWDEAVKWYRAAARQRDTTAMIWMAMCHNLGVGVALDHEKAQAYCRQVLEIDRENKYAGIVLDKSDLLNLSKVRMSALISEKHLKMIRAAAMAGDRVAQRRMGNNYEYGSRGFEQDLEKAFYWMRKAADQNDVEALWRVGYDYYRGYGTERDEKAALEWFLRAEQLEPENDTVHVMLARVYILSKDLSLRDPVKGLHYAKITCAKLEAYVRLDMLSRAYAANGMYTEASEIAEQYRKIWKLKRKDKPISEDIQRRFLEYKEKSKVEL